MFLMSSKSLKGAADPSCDCKKLVVCNRANSAWRNFSHGTIPMSLLCDNKLIIRPVGVYMMRNWEAEY